MMKKAFTLLALFALSVSMRSQTAAALDFDGTDDYVDIGSVIPMNSSYTKEAWVYADDYYSNNIISSNSSPFWLNNGSLKVFGNNNGSVIVADPAAFPLQQWVHVAATYNAATNELNLYKNGVLVGSGITSGSYPGDAIAVGQYGPSGANFFQGDIDEVRIWNRPLCQAEIQNNMNAELSLPQTGLLAYYKFNQGVASGTNTAVTTLTDATSNSNNGTLYNFALTGTVSNWISPGGVTSGSVASTFTAPAISGAVSSQTNLSCIGGNNGILTVTTNVAASSYSWMPSGGTASVAANLTAGVYTCMVTSACGATAAITGTVTPPAALSASISISNPHCQLGYGSATVTAGGGSGSYTYTWSTTDNSSFISFAHAGSYSVAVTDAVCNTTATATATLVDPPAIYYTFGSSPIVCHGGTGAASVIATGGSGSFTYLWTNGATTNTVSGLAPGGYSVTVTDGYSCSNSMGVTIVDPPVLTASISVTNPLCSGGQGSATVTTSGGVSPYTYSLASTAVSATISSLNAGSYSVSVKDANGCTITNTLSVDAPSGLSITASASSASVCAGNSTTLTAGSSGGTGAVTYSWAAGPSTGTYAVAPAVNATYTVNGTDANGCAASKTIAITAAALPTLAVSNATICSGTSATIAPSGAGTYTISGNNFTVTPSANASYTITGTGSNGCAASNTVVASVAVNTTPTVSVNNATICSGATAVITPTGASTYTITGNSFSVTPNSTSSYTVRGTAANGCLSNSVIATVSVNVTPTLTVNNAAICAGHSVVITPSGAATYSITGNTFTVTPATTTSYTVTGTSTAGCVSAAAVTSVVVNANPTLSVNSASICAGNVATITVSGALAYTISGGSPIVNPAVTTSYSITGAGINGCVSSVISTITVYANPTISVNSATVCAGNPAVIMPTGASTYIVSGGTFTVSPIATTDYSVIGVDNHGCVSSAVVSTVTVNANPTISVNSASICAGNSVVIVPTGASTYTISGGTYTVNPAATANYTITGTDNNGCVSSAIVSTITVNNPTIAVNSASICEGNSVVIVPTGAFTYTISGGTFTVSPTATTDYSVSGTDANGCVSGEVVSSVTVHALPTLTLSSSSSTICVNETATLSVSGASTYTWSTTQTSSTIVITPTTAGNMPFSVAGVDANGCMSAGTVSLNVSTCDGIRTQNAVSANMQVYPNPNNGEFTVEATENSSIVVMNTLGEIVYSQTGTSGKASINISHLSNGIYFVKAMNGNNQQTVKLIKE